MGVVRFGRREVAPLLPQMLGFSMHLAELSKQTDHRAATGLDSGEAWRESSGLQGDSRYIADVRRTPQDYGGVIANTGRRAT